MELEEALVELKQGKEITRPGLSRNLIYGTDPEGVYAKWGGSQSISSDIVLTSVDMIAKDWKVVEESTD